MYICTHHIFFISFLIQNIALNLVSYRIYNKDGDSYVSMQFYFHNYYTYFHKKHNAYIVIKL